MATFDLILNISLRGIMLSALLLQGCMPGFRPIETDTEITQPLEDLVFRDVTLEQADSDGSILWQLQANQATYQEDRQITKVDQPFGLLFRDEEPTYEVKARNGEVYEDGQRILLWEDVVVTHLPTAALLRGKELEWYPEQDVLIIRDNVEGTYKDLIFTAHEGRYTGLEQQTVSLKGDIVATLQNSQLRLKTELLEWHIEEETVVGPQTALIERYDPEDADKVIEWASGGGLSVDLATQRSTLTPEAKINLANPPLDITSDTLTWDALQDVLETDQPVDILHRADKITVSADRGVMNLEEEIVDLNGNVDGFNPQQQARLLAEQLTWEIPAQRIEATGDVVYTATDPELMITGDRAIGRLDEEIIEVSSDEVVKTVYTLE